MVDPMEHPTRGGSIHKNGNVPSALLSGFRLAEAFEHSTGMPINEFCKALQELKSQLTELSRDIERKDEKAEKRVDLLRDMILGTVQAPGIDGRLRSVEADRDALKGRLNLML